MALLRTWLGRRTLAGVVACLVALQAFVAGLHAARAVDLQLLANDLALICHGAQSDPVAPTQPIPDHASTCCLLGCNVGGQAAKLTDTAFVPPSLMPTRVELPLPAFALLPTRLIDRAHRPRSPPIA